MSQQFQITIQSDVGPDATSRNLRGVLKRLLRTYQFKCLSIVPVSLDATEGKALRRKPVEATQASGPIDLSLPTVGPHKRNGNVSRSVRSVAT